MKELYIGHERTKKSTGKNCTVDIRELYSGHKIKVWCLERDFDFSMSQPTFGTLLEKDELALWGN